jgi:AraC-like DNA-binding protein
MVNPRGVPSEPDALGDALHMLHLTGALYCRAEGAAPWGVELPALPGYITLPVVLSGSCILEVDGDAYSLSAGSAALITRGQVHRMLSSSGVASVPLFELPTERVSDRYERMDLGGDGQRTRIAYAVLRTDDVLTRRLVAELPHVIVVDEWDEEEAGAFAAVLRLLAREAASIRPGGETIMTRLSDVLVVQVIRWWLATGSVPEEGWIAALGDRHIGGALASMHRDSSRQWTIASLAAGANLSRSAFAERFTSLVGTPPMSYLTTWRLDQARSELIRTDQPIASVSARVGYSSEAAFSRAFRRQHGLTPGEARRSAAPGTALRQGLVST